jgi:hypothetical protein
MGWRNSYEMTAATVLSVIPLLCLVWLNITMSAQCGAYCASAVVAVLVLLRYRGSKYSMQMQRAAPPWKSSLPVFKLAREGLPRATRTGEHPCCRTTGRRYARLPLGLGRGWSGKPVARESR